jgi:uncharacterized membrane protein/mono/diheme cytochrome c family protein
MNRYILIAFHVLMVSLFTWPGVTAASGFGRDLASDVHAVFKARCAGCHGADLAKPKGRFGYVLDLARVASNPEMVVPSYPSESELWEFVRRGVMPPEDSPTGPLSQEEQQVIEAWIAAGAPADSPLDTEQVASERVPLRSAPSFEKTVLHWLGPFHLVAVHFPIALLIAAAFAEFCAAQRGSRIPTPEVRFCVLLGATSAVIAASLGWIHAGNGHGVGAPRTLDIHRWIGTATAVWSVVTALLVERQWRRGVRSQWFRAWLLVGAILVAVEGHFGGMLVHGDDFLKGG